VRLGIATNRLTRAGIRGTFGLTATQLRSFEAAGVAKFDDDGQIDACAFAYDVLDQALKMASRAELRSLEVAKFARAIASCAATMVDVADAVADDAAGARALKDAIRLHSSTMLQMYEATLNEWVSEDDLEEAARS
jgi:hypothetical protein